MAGYFHFFNVRKIPYVIIFTLWLTVFAALRAFTFSARRSWSACAAGYFAFPADENPSFLLPFGREFSPSGDVWDASPAWGKGGLLGAAPLLDPLCTPPGAPPERAFHFPQNGEGTRLLLRELPSLATLAQVISLRDA